MRVCGHEGRAVVLPVSYSPYSCVPQAWGCSRDRFVDSQSQVHDLPGRRHVERRERGAKRRDIEQPDPVLDQLRHQVHEDLIDEPSLQALINDVCPEHEHIAALGSRQRGRHRVPDITGKEDVGRVGLVSRWRVGQNEMRTAPASVEQPALLGSLHPPADLVDAAASQHRPSPGDDLVHDRARHVASVPKDPAQSSLGPAMNPSSDIIVWTRTLPIITSAIVIGNPTRAGRQTHRTSRRGRTLAQTHTYSRDLSTDQHKP